MSRNTSNVLLKQPPASEMKNSGVYLISTEDNALKYVGSTCNFSNRLAGHKFDCKRGKGNRHLQSHVSKYGWESLIFTLLEVVDDKSDLKNRENFWINHYGFENLINLAPDARDPRGIKMPDSHREKTSRRMKGKTYTKGYKHKKEKGEKCALYWETHPEEKERMRERNRESQKSVDRSSWIKGKIIEVSLNGVVIDKCYGKKEVMSKYDIKHVTCSKLVSGERESYKGYSLKYIGSFFKSDTIDREVYY